METSQGDELELVSHGCELGLEAGDGGVVQFLLPIKRWRAVVCQHLAGKLRVDRFGELASFVQIGMRCFAPDEVGVWRVGEGACNCGVDAAADTKETFWGSLSSKKFAVARIYVAG